MAWHKIAQRIKQSNYRLKQKLWPASKAPKLHYKELAEAAARPGMVVLHAGGGRNKHGLFQGRSVRRVNVDLDQATLAQDAGADLRVLGNLEFLPVRENTVDLIVCEMVFEHVADPEGIVRGFFRCLRAGGQVVFITPNVKSYPFLISKITPFWFHRLYGFLRGRRGEDIFPTHYRLNSVAAIQRHFGKAGFESVQLRQIDSSCDYFDVFPGVYLIMAAFSQLLNRCEALSSWRQFHLGCFRKPARSQTPSTLPVQTLVAEA